MSYKIECFFYPYIEQVKKLPVYLCGIGATEYQGHILRREGYRCHQILHCFGGEGRLIYDDTTIEIAAGDYLFLPKAFPHEYYPLTDKWGMQWLTFDGTDCDRILEEFHMHRPFVVNLTEDLCLQDLYDKIFLTQKTDKYNGNYSCSGYMYQYLIEFYRLFSDKKPIGNREHASMLIPALEYIEENFRNNFPISELSGLLGISHQYFCKIFLQAMNVRPNEYLTMRRIQEAKNLLMKTDIPIAKISEKVGFHNGTYFCAMFKRYEGISPNQFRIQNKGIRQLRDDK